MILNKATARLWTLSNDNYTRVAPAYQSINPEITYRGQNNEMAGHKKLR